MPKRPAIKQSDEKEVKSNSESEDEALGDLELDRTGEDGESDDTDSSVYSELEEDETDDDDEEEDEEVSDEGEGEEESEDEGNESNGEKNNEEDSVNEESGDKNNKNKKEETNTDDRIVKIENGEITYRYPVDATDPNLSKKQRERNLRRLARRAAEEARARDEYAYDSSDEEEIRNTVGNIPMNWYDEYPHLGYDIDGKQIKKPPQGDTIDAFMDKMENPEWGVTVDDPLTGQKVILSERDGNIVKRITEGKVPDPDYDLYAPWVDFYTGEVMETSLRGNMPSKASFIPSKAEQKFVRELAQKIRRGLVKPRSAKITKDDQEQKFYMLWNTDDQAEDGIKRISNHIPAPKMKLPGHEESYNPPPEYLFTEEEKKKWELAKEGGGRLKLPYIPQKYSALRKVPGWSNFIKERFDRCMDLYLAPRARKMRINVKPEDLVPQMPRPQDLQPFPTVCSITFKGHNNMIRCITIEPKGQYFMSGSDDGTCKVWELQTGRCLKTFEFGGVIKSCAWCPNEALSLAAVTLDNKVLLINTGVGDKVIVDRTNEILTEEPDNTGYVPPVRVAQAIKWTNKKKEMKDYPAGTLIAIEHFKAVSKVTWHAKGDYFASLCPEGDNKSVFIHQLSKWRTQLPFNKAKGLVQTILFHPIRPFLFVATQRNVRVYDLVKQELAKKLTSTGKWISSMAIHPGGDNVLVGTYDKKVNWFDMDLSSSAYKNLRFHYDAVRSVDFHKRYPLFASAGDDNAITVSHGMVYSDLLLNPLIVPVKKLTGHTKYDDFGVQCLQWHPTQPWLLSSAADGYIKLWT